MSSELYTVLALGMRYWFTFLGALIVLRAFVWLLKDRRENHRRLHRLPDAGMIGELVVLEGSEQLPEGAVISVPREGVLGFNRTCDVVIPADGVAGRHLDFIFVRQRGLYLTPRFRLSCEVDGQVLTHRSRAKDTPLMHGSTLRVGDALLRLRVFAGIDVAHYARAQEEDQPMPPPPQAVPDGQPQWQPAPMPPMQGMPPPVAPTVWFQPGPSAPQFAPPEPVVGYRPTQPAQNPPPPPSDYSFRYQPDAPTDVPVDDIEDEVDDSFSAPVYPIPQPASTAPDYADDDEASPPSPGRRRRRRAERRTLNEED